MSDIAKWDIEDSAFWESTGKRVANRNLWISIPSLLCGFAVWLYWGIITVQMLNLGFPFAKAELFTLAAIAALGLFVTPMTLGVSINLTGTPHTAMIIFIGFYLSCLLTTWWWYARRGAEVHCD